jgi:hypothetical protein
MIEPISATPTPARAAQAGGTRRPAAAAPLEASDPVPVPAVPPPEVLDDLDTAARVLGDFDAKGHSLHLHVDQAGGRVSVEVLDASGRTVTVLPGTQALDLLAGEPGGLADWHA